jgi:hypothetical protein
LPESLAKKTRPLVDIYFRHILDRNLAAAERVLMDIRESVKDSVWEQGYINALEGILVAQRSGDTRYVFLSRLDLNDRRKVEEARRYFQVEAKNTLQGEFDRGFFSAWSEFMRIARTSLEDDKGAMAKTLNGFIKE